MKQTASNSATTEPMVLVHPFQTAGMGVAPYRFITVIVYHSGEGMEAARRAAMRDAAGLGVNLCSCEFCGASLTNNYVIRDAKGSHFVVGCDCVQKTGDTELITATEAARRALEATRRDAKRAQAEADKEAAREATRNAEKASYGKTLEELHTDAEAVAEARKQSAITAATAPTAALLEVLNTANPGNGEFLPNILAELNGGRLFSDLPDRALTILSEVYAKVQTGKTKRNPEFQDTQGAFFDAIGATVKGTDEAFAQYRADMKTIREAYKAAKNGGKWVLPAHLTA